MEETFPSGVAPASAHQRAGFQVDIVREVIDNLVDKLLRKGDTGRHRGAGRGGIKVAVPGKRAQPPCLHAVSITGIVRDCNCNFGKLRARHPREFAPQYQGKRMTCQPVKLQASSFKPHRVGRQYVCTCP